MKHDRRSQSRKCANGPVPNSLTSVVTEGINLLPPDPRVLHLQSEYLKKYVSRDTAPGSLRRLRAINKWLAVDRDNLATSERLLTYPEYHQILPGVTVREFKDTVRRFIVSVIGEVPTWESLFGGFSGGASTSKKRGNSLPSMKYVGKAHASASVAELWSVWAAEEAPEWFRSVDDFVDVMDRNVLFTVPKTTEIDRCACKEPDLNMYFQRGFGLEIRSALRRVGINLNDQSINRRLARMGSADGSLATLDLSSASDSVTTTLVAELLPPVWFTMLDLVRSKSTFVPGVGVVEAHMFSSMGNGFTFELESLLFLALARATAFHLGVRGTISVYGDDIIVPTMVARYLSYVLEFFGFQVNPDKSFDSGPFRESCGGHYLHGYDVSPFYLRKPIERLTDLILILNNIRRWSCHELPGVHLFEVWQELKAHVPSKLLAGPSAEGSTCVASPVTDGGFHHLVEITVKRSNPLGDYLRWLDSNFGRLAPPEEESMVIATGTERFRMRKRPGWSIRPCEHYFVEECLA